LTREWGDLIQAIRGSDRPESNEERCEDCTIPLITTPDGTKCCPQCGLVVGRAYSWMGHEAPPSENAWDIYEMVYERGLSRFAELTRKHWKRE
jgi:hypothetical protein